MIISSILHPLASETEYMYVPWSRPPKLKYTEFAELDIPLNVRVYGANPPITESIKTSPFWSPKHEMSNDLTNALKESGATTMTLSW